MTGRQYLFKQVGHAFASLGYIIKWYLKLHGDLPGGPKEWHRYCQTLCSACKWKNYYKEKEAYDNDRQTVGRGY